MENCFQRTKQKSLSWIVGSSMGMGSYEAVRLYAGKIFRSEAHWKRLDHSLKSIALKIPWTHSQLTQACQRTAAGNHLREALVRVTISRGAGPLGYDPRTCKHPTMTVVAQPIRSSLSMEWGKGVSAAMVQVRRNSCQSLSPAIKHTNGLNAILAKIESLKTKAFEGIFLNLEGYVTEGTISNVMLLKKGILKTPTLQSGILEGVTRKTVLEVAKKMKVPVQEKLIRPKELLNADEVFLTSTTLELMPVIKIDKKKNRNRKTRKDHPRTP